MAPPVGSVSSGVRRQRRYAVSPYAKVAGGRQAVAAVHSDDGPPGGVDPLRILFRGSDGPLPALLLLLTTVTGLVDSVSYLVLGKVFVANMAGNLIFVGFGLSAVGTAVAPSAVAIGAFLVGCVAGGRAVQSLAHHRGGCCAEAQRS
ncbi:DUF1275 family protein [Streptomyces sp. NPDC048248]|uniref:DUF1275 family protein n=1 Tax=Streptomyces sp. NPDC048248 TaxID=3365523 RepID=UPI00372349CE